MPTPLKPRAPSSEPAGARTRAPCGEPPPSLAVACPICGLLARLDLRSIGTTACPRGHPIPVGDVPGVREVVAWVEEVVGMIPGGRPDVQLKPNMAGSSDVRASQVGRG